VLARTTRSGDETVVEAITKVQSIDLVADPATTSGLYEHAGDQELRDKSQEPEFGSSANSVFDALTLEALRLHRPDLISELERPLAAQLESVQEELEKLAAREASARRPKSKDQRTIVCGVQPTLITTAAEFAAAVRGRL
jgi:hypothetical protein